MYKSKSLVVVSVLSVLREDGGETSVLVEGGRGEGLGVFGD